jgi:tetratricopeptide (TPR) repeat protein
VTARSIACLLVLIGLGAAAWFVLRGESNPTPVPSSESQPAIPVRADSESPYNSSQFHLTVDQAIQQFESRVAGDPNHLNLTLLGRAYIRKAAQDGDLAAYGRAGDAFQRALQFVPGHVPARVGLAWVACAQHRFADAVQQAEALRREWPQEIEPLVILGDAQLELGNYEDARRAYRELQDRSPAPAPPAVLARLARLAELHGNVEEALTLLTKAAAMQRDATDFQPSAAWYSMRLGELQFSQGRYDEAAKHLETALAAHPKYPAALALLGRTRFAQGRTDEAIGQFKRIMNLNPDLSMLADLGDLYAKTGQDFLGKTLHESVEKTAAGKREYDRELALFYCNHDRELPKALELAQRDLEIRKDIYAYDTLAWALCKNGRAEDAQEVMSQGLKLGTQDAALFYHAGVICEQLGQREKAREHLTRALKLNPAFSITQADKARQMLESFATQK